jgi:FkbM family methyltransferase
MGFMFEKRHGEYEISQLNRLVDTRKTSVDIGALNGTYAYYLSQYGPVVAFEPNPARASRLRRILPKLTVWEVALSDTAGTATLSIPKDSSGGAADGWATLEAFPGQDAAAQLLVETNTLDHYQIDTGFIKIDVEGHEESVLRGAIGTLKKCRPVVMIEIEERHNPGSTKRIPEWMKELGYNCHFFLDETLRSIEEFDADRMQPDNFKFEGRLHRRSIRYINNFIFRPE